ncbi:hypothetical protein J31TS4_01990 [Paenibacillus sp. J31TS4]|uniref:hypothetical protein n=1 Tax=Paenibacillus sp. J31TS4 TaxID=2807195 RepID=UPI001B2A9D07|nr:hypothetical protein [Paenibacillus sp. J31TS4]GIP36919.1 hypothetical protein J31TS4_01990 [Paenibacillus sp. J31TS4]
MTGTATRFFGKGHTARGVHFLYPSALQGAEKRIELQGPPGTGKSTALRRLADHLLTQGTDIQCFHSPLYPDDLDALYIPSRRIAVADASVCGGLPESSAVQRTELRFDEAAEPGRLTEEQRQELRELEERLQPAYEEAYALFAEALRIHDEWEQYYIGSMDFAKADEVASETALSLFGETRIEKTAQVRHVFFGAATPRGAVDHIQNLTASCGRRIFIKGRAGSGKSTLLKRLAAEAEARGIDVEVFHCGFDPNSLDMLIFPELGTAIFDSTAPHEYFPDRAEDEVLDMYERVLPAGIDERYAGDLAAVKARYSNAMKKATAQLGEVQRIDARIKELYGTVTDYATADRLSARLLAEVEDLSAPAAK